MESKLTKNMFLNMITVKQTSMSEDNCRLSPKLQSHFKLALQV